tara:strand:- start:366 stop:689 length:324 start_codon:yes stop_codon:yes gene_type:complete
MWLALFCRASLRIALGCSDVFEMTIPDNQFPVAPFADFGLAHTYVSFFRIFRAGTDCGLGAVVTTTPKPLGNDRSGNCAVVRQDRRCECEWILRQQLPREQTAASSA